ncbi:hypothetical protein JCM5353_005844 [Sporobolomyces roseus]
MSRLFHPRASSNGNNNKGEKGEGGKKSNQVAQQQDSVDTPISPRPKPFSFSSLSFRRPSTASSQSTITPPASRIPTPPHEQLVDKFEEPLVHTRVPPPSPHETSHLATSYFDFSHSSLPPIDNKVTLTAFHAHTVPPSPLSASYLSPRNQDSSYTFPSPSPSQVSHIGEEPVSRFSDWGTSIEGTSRNPSSEDLSDEDEAGSITELTSFSHEQKEKDIKTHLEHLTISPSPCPSESPSPPSLLPPPNRRSAPTTTARRHRPHLLLHHHHSTHARLPRESRVADSSFPELAIAFFSSVEKFRESKGVERRASTGSLGGAV